MPMTLEQFDEAKSEALQMAADLVDFAKQRGWEKTREPKANKKFAFVVLTRETNEIGDIEQIKAFYAIDADAENDQVIHVQPSGREVILDPEAGDVRSVITSNDEVYRPKDAGEQPVPPTGAAHQRTMPPIDEFKARAIEHGAIGAAHQDLDAAHSAAREAIDEMNADLDAAHTDDEDEVVDDSVPPIGEQTIPEHFGVVPPADEADVADEAMHHMSAAEEAAVKGEHAVRSQQEIYGAVRHQQVNPGRNWSAVASPLTNAEILTKLGANRKTKNVVEIVWLNSLSNTLDRANVSGGADRYPPHITPADFDPEEHGEDLRILHFLEHGGGFRSVAVARIKRIG